VSDCDDAGAANMPQLMANATAATIAVLRRLPGRAAVSINGLSLIRRPGILRQLTLVPNIPRYNSAMSANPRRSKSRVA
jgi:hypothetical protein